MNQKIQCLILSLIVLLSVCIADAQTTESKSCGACGKSVSIYSRVGDTCPHCKVVWGQENKTSTSIPNYQYTQPNSNSSDNYYPSQESYSPPEGTPHYERVPNYYYRNGEMRYSDGSKPQKVIANPFLNYSKDALANWILSNLNKYSTEYSNCTSMEILRPENNCYRATEYVFKFQNDCLIIAFKKKYGGNDIVVYIPLYDYSDLYIYENKLRISNQGRTIRSEDRFSGSSSEWSMETIGIKRDLEPDFEQKLEYAFKELSKKCSKPYSLPSYTTKTDTDRPSLSATKAWIIEKLNLYNKEFKSCKFDGFNLIFSNPKRGNVNELAVPICDCYVDRKTFELSLEEKLGVRFSSGIKNIRINYSNGGVSYSKSYVLRYDYDMEYNIWSRLDKAFINLRYYCPKDTKRKETF